MSYRHDSSRCRRCSRGISQEDMDAGHKTCYDCRMAALDRRRDGHCIYCRTTIGEAEDVDNLGNGVCPDCRQRLQYNRAANYRRTHPDAMTNAQRRAARACPLCGEKGLYTWDQRSWECGRCHHRLVLVNGIRSDLSRLSRDQQAQARRCPSCGKKRLLGLSERRFECAGCQSAFIRHAPE